MNLEIDHIFICCTPGAPEGDALARHGLHEGQPNTHLGQGTANRRFFFENLYLELLYVSNEQEVRSPNVWPLQLWERCTGGDAVSPFGILLRPAAPVDGAADAAPAPAPFDVWQYHPDYLPPNLAIEVASESTLQEPALFHLPFAMPKPGAASPHSAANSVKITGVTIGLTDLDVISPGLLLLHQHGLVRFEKAAHHVLTLHGDWGNLQGMDFGPRLPLVLAP